MLIRRLIRILHSPVVIVAVALALRLSVAPSFVGWLSANGRGNPFAENEPSHIAAHLARGEGFSSPYEGTPLQPSAQQPPLYPFFIAAIFKIAGVYSHSSALAIIGFNCFLGAFVCWLIYGVGRRWFSPPAAAIAAWVWALSPVAIVTNLYLSNYLLSSFFVLLWIGLLSWNTNQTGKRSFFLGATLGVFALLNSMLLILFPASWRWLAPTKRHAALCLCAIALVVSPWMVRNYLQLGHIYPGLRDSFGQALYVGNHPGMSDHRPQCAWNLCGGTADYTDAGNDHAQLAQMGEAEFMRMKLEKSLAYIKSAPRKFLARSAKRAAAFWLLPQPLFYLPLILLAWIGAFRSPLRSLLLTMFVLYPLAYYATETVWAASYRLPLEPLLLLSAAYLVCSLWRQPPTAESQPSSSLKPTALSRDSASVPTA